MPSVFVDLEVTALMAKLMQKRHPRCRSCKEKSGTMCKSYHSSPGSLSVCFKGWFGEGKGNLGGEAQYPWLRARAACHKHLCSENVVRDSGLCGKCTDSIPDSISKS